MADQGINGPNDPNDTGVSIETDEAVMPVVDGAVMAPAQDDQTDPDEDPSVSR